MVSFSKLAILLRAMLALLLAMGLLSLVSLVFAKPSWAHEGHQHEISSITWDEVAPYSLQRTEMQGGVVNEKLYVFGGLLNWADGSSGYQASTRSDVYDPATNTWTRLADTPTPVTHAGTAVDGNFIYLVGGYVGDHPGPGTTEVWRYDTSNDTWTAFTPLPEARGAGAAVRIGRNLHFFGGMEETRTVDKGDHWVLALDEANPTWKPAAPLPAPRNHLGGVVLDGKIYAVGGQFGQEMDAVVQTAVHVYDPSTNAWKAAASLPLPRSQMHQSTLVFDKRIIVLGGEDYPAHALTDVTMYDPLLNSWRGLTPMPAQRKAGTAGVIGGQIFFAQGAKYGTRLYTTTFRGIPQFNECTITGTSGADTLQGTEGDDVICGLGGSDTIRGLGGNDILKGGNGSDTLYGGEGADTLQGEGGNDRLIGEAGNDALDGGTSTDTASYKPSTAGVEASLTANTATSATDGSDTLANLENLEGTNYADTLTGSTLPNNLSGLSGNDKLSGEDGADQLYGGGHNDQLSGGGGNDSMQGSGGADVFYGEDGDDALNSKDNVSGNDTVDGGPGTDTCTTDATEKSIANCP